MREKIKPYPPIPLLLYKALSVLASCSTSVAPMDARSLDAVGKNSNPIIVEIQVIITKL